jgi:hypothetical protein
MKIHSKFAAIAATLVLSATPAVAFAAPGGQHGKPTGKTHTSKGNGKTHTSKAKAYGKFCQGESKTHVAGTPGTPFSKCVTDMAKAANGSHTNPAKACANESKKHVAGTPGTPYSICVSGAKKLLSSGG